MNIHPKTPGGDQIVANVCVKLAIEYTIGFINEGVVVMDKFMYYQDLETPKWELIHIPKQPKLVKYLRQAKEAIWEMAISLTSQSSQTITMARRKFRRG